MESGSGMEQMEESDGGIRREHEMFADEERVETRFAEADEIIISAETGFADGDAIVGNVRNEIERGLRRDLERFEVAIVDAEDASAGGEGTVELGAGVNLDERLHAKFAAEGEKVAELRVGERDNHEEETVGFIGTGFPNLPGIKNEILAEGGEGDLGAGIAKIFEGATKEFGFGEDGESGGSGGFESGGESGGIEGIADDAARGRGGLELGDDVQ